MRVVMGDRIYPTLRAYLKHHAGVDLAREMGCSAAFISMIKHGERQPDLAFAIRLADHCHIPLESLIKRPYAKVG